MRSLAATCIEIVGAVFVARAAFEVYPPLGLLVVGVLLVLLGSAVDS
jgi:hypothetical protein